MDLPGFEPGAFYLRSKRDTTTPQTHSTEICVTCEMLGYAGKISLKIEIKSCYNEITGSIKTKLIDFFK